MKIELIKVDNETVGYDLIPESKEDRLILGSIRHLWFWGTDNTRMVYDGIKTEQAPEGTYVTNVRFMQEQYTTAGIVKRAADMLSGTTDIEDLKSNC